MSDGETVAVGDIVAAHGLRGLVRIRVYQPPAPSLVAGHVVTLEQHGARRQARLLSAGLHGRSLVLAAFDGVEDRTTAEALVGARVYIAAADLPPTQEGEFYYHEVVGFRVVTTEGRELGHIVNTFSTGLNDVWTVQGEREYLIPVIADVVRTLDREQRTVTVYPMAGLLD